MKMLLRDIINTQCIALLPAQITKLLKSCVGGKVHWLKKQNWNKF